MVGTYEASVDKVKSCLARILVDVLVQPSKFEFPCVLRADSAMRVHVYTARSIEDLQTLPTDEDDLCGVVESIDELRRNLLARLA